MTNYSDYLDFTANSYCKTAFARNTYELIRNAETQLVGQNIDFDSMVGIGNSGLLVLPILARHFDVPFFAMRKPGILHHNSKQPHGDGIIGRRWILVDDVSILGNTMTYTTKTIRSLTEPRNFNTEYVGTYLYEPLSMSPGEFVYPDGTKKSVQKITVDSNVHFVNFGIYNKVREISARLYKPGVSMLGSVIEAVMSAYPSWDLSTVVLIAKYLEKS